jgi:hypothetical protein
MGRSQRAQELGTASSQPKEAEDVFFNEPGGVAERPEWVSAGMERFAQGRNRRANRRALERRRTGRDMIMA